jgi:hypothetical protein
MSSVVEPDFVSMYEIGDYVYVFFREVAIEYINCGKVSALFHPHHIPEIINQALIFLLSAFYINR